MVLFGASVLLLVFATSGLLFIWYQIARERPW